MKRPNSLPAYQEVIWWSKLLGRLQGKDSNKLCIYFLSHVYETTIQWRLHLYNHLLRRLSQILGRFEEPRILAIIVVAYYFWVE